MRKFRILLLILALATCTFGAQAAKPEIETLMERARDLFDYGRWSDARHEFLRAKAVLPPSDRLLVQEVEFYLAACAVELGSADAEGALRDFGERYPESVYANDVRFALGSFYCSDGNMKKAREAFEKTDYKALSAPRREQYDIRMGYVEFGDGNYAKAYDYFDRIGAAANMWTSPLLQSLYRLRRGALRPREAGFRNARTQRRLPRCGAVLPSADRVPRGQLPLCG